MKNLDLIKEKIGSKKKIFVTGPERSGTRITARIIADLLEFRYIDEGFPHCYLHNNWKELILNHSNFVLQCPRHTCICHNFCFNEDAFVVFCRRNVEDIVCSQKRIGWKASKKEYDRYLDQFPSLPLMMPEWDKLKISDLKYFCWDNIQKPNIKENFYYDCEYGFLQEHRFWKDKEKRRSFKWNQWK